MRPKPWLFDCRRPDADTVPSQAAGLRKASLVLLQALQIPSPQQGLSMIHQIVYNP